MNSTNKWLLTDEEKDKFIATLTPNLTILRRKIHILTVLLMVRQFTMERNLHTPTPTLLKTRSCTTPFLRFVLVFIRKQLALMKPSLLSERLQI